MLREIKLYNFRSYAEQTLQFDSAWTLFVGENGSGKSNLLESIFFLTMLRSFRTSQPKEMIKHSESSLALGGVIERGIWKEELHISYANGGERRLIRNGNGVRRSSEFIGQVLPVAFIPEDIMLISGSGATRRRFIDMYISLLNPQYQSGLYRYNSALQQRNAALKRGVIAKTSAMAFEPILAENAVYIEKQRRIFSSLLADEVRLLLADEEDYNFTMNYRPNQPAESVEAYRELLANDRARDIKRCTTISGPQLDDFQLNLNGQPMRSFASMGQRRKIAIYLKLAAYTILRKQIKSNKTSIMVLVDDVTGELDEANKQRFFESIKSADQAFFTFTELPNDPAFQSAGVYNIEKSQAICLRR